MNIDNKNKAVEKLDKKLGSIGRNLSAKMKKLKEYEPYIAVALGIAIIISGISIGHFLESGSPSGFHSAEILDDKCIEDWSCTEWSECSEGKQERNCYGSGVCSTENEKPDEEKDCISEDENPTVPHASGMAVSDTSETAVPDEVLKPVIYATSILSCILIVAYVSIAYIKKKSPDASVLAVSYWLVMVGIPFTIYFIITREEHIWPAYISLAVSVSALSALAVLNPWKKPELKELHELNRLLGKNSSSWRTERIRKTRGSMVAGFRRLLRNMSRIRIRREMRVAGLESLETGSINKRISELGTEPEASESLEEVEEAVKEREEKFSKLNMMLSRWAEKKRKKMQEISVPEPPAEGNNETK